MPRKSQLQGYKELSTAASGGPDWEVRWDRTKHYGFSKVVFFGGGYDLTLKVCLYITLIKI